MRAKPMRAMFAALGTAAVVAAAVVSAAPAYADASPSASPNDTQGAASGADTGFVGWVMNPVVLAVNGGPGKTYPVLTFEGGDLSDVQLTFDLGKLAGVATASFPDPTSNCTVNGTTATCNLPDHSGEDFSTGLVPLKLVPAVGAVDGFTATLKVSVSATGMDSWSDTVPVSVADGPDLVVAGSQEMTAKAVKAGDVADLPFSFANLGSQPADGVFGFFDFTHGFAPDSFDNCEYAADDSVGGTIAFCTFDSPMPVNGSVDFDFTGKITGDAATDEYGIGIVGTAFDMSGPNAVGSPDIAKNRFINKTGGFKHRARTGKKLMLKTKAQPSVSKGDIDQTDNAALFNWHVAGATHDVAAIGATLSGNIGDSVKAELGVKNNGPSSVNTALSSDALASFLVTVPQGTKVTKVSDNCAGVNDLKDAPSDNAWGAPGFKYYQCSDWNDLYLPVSGQVGLKFTFKITGTNGTDGSVAINTKSGAGLGDTVAANNTAKITQDASGDGSLPTTGSKTGIIAGSGAILVLVGGVLLFAGRRRRRQSASA